MSIRDYLSRWGWLCPWVMLGLAVAILIVFGISVWTAVLVAMLLVCPAIVVWGVIYTRRRL